MRRVRTSVFAAVCLLVWPGLLLAQAAEWRTLSFHMARPGATPDRYTIQLQPDGSGVYWEGQPDFNIEEAISPSRITIHPPLLVQVSDSFSTVRSGRCETHQKNIAKTGQKTLVFAGEGGTAQCTFNYSDDDRLNAVAGVFLALAETMQAGQRLARLHRYDRLGLDAEMDTFAGEVKDGRAKEVQNIAPVLASIAQDDRVIERVRRQAARLLQDAGVAPDASVSAR